MTYSASISTEVILLLRSVSNIESQYIARSSNRINETVGQSFSSATRVSPGSSEGTNVARVVVNEIDTARFDPLLVRAVAKNAASCLDNILSKLEGTVCTSFWGYALFDMYSQITRDRSAISLNITQATPQQITNANLANFCYQAWSRLSKIEEEQGSAVYSSLESSVQVRNLCRR